MNLPEDVRQCLSVNKQSIEIFTTIYQVDGERNFIQSFDSLATQNENVHNSLLFYINEEEIILFYDFRIANIGHTSFDVFRKRGGVWKKKKSTLTKIR